MVDCHVIYTIADGSVHQLEMQAESFADCEARFQLDHPEAKWWTIGIEMSAFNFPSQEVAECLSN